MGDEIVLTLIEKMVCIPGAVFAFTFKAFCHAFSSDKLGDPTPRNQGKLTMNPLAHLDIIGFLFIMFFGYGWCKPVQVNSRYYKHIKRDCAIQILSGPIGCIFAGFIFALLYVVCCGLFGNGLILGFDTSLGAAGFISYMLWYAMEICFFLGLFHLLPIPGFDGFNLIMNFLPAKAYRAVYSLQKYSLIIFIGVILLLNYTPLGNLLLYYPSMFLITKSVNLWTALFGFLFK